LIAEEVAEVNPTLVVRDKDGKPYSVRYDQVNAMLLNEFLKEHKAFLEEQRKIDRMETLLRAVSERLKQQEAKLVNVNAPIGLTNSTESRNEERLAYENSNVTN
jgi:predicted RNase H-like nuclease